MCGNSGSTLYYEAIKQLFSQKGTGCFSERETKNDLFHNIEKRSIYGCGLNYWVKYGPQRPSNNI